MVKIVVWLVIFVWWNCGCMYVRCFLMLMFNWIVNLEVIKKFVNSKMMLGKLSEFDLFFMFWRILVMLKYGRRIVLIKKESMRLVFLMLWRGFLIMFKGFFIIVMIMIVFFINVIEVKISEIVLFISKNVVCNFMVKWFCLIEIFSVF